MTKEDFFLGTIAKFKGCKPPKRKPDFVSYNKYGEISSEYWYTDNAVIRRSNHWSKIHTIGFKPFDRGFYELYPRSQGTNWLDRECRARALSAKECGRVGYCKWSIATNVNEEVLTGKCLFKHFKPRKAYLLK